MSVIRFFTARTHGRRAQWWISFALFTLLMGAWAVAQPYNAGPDELSYFLVFDRRGVLALEQRGRSRSTP